MLEKYRLRYEELRPTWRHRIGRAMVRPVCVVMLLTFPIYWTVASLVDSWSDAKTLLGQLLCIVIYGIEEGEDMKIRQARKVVRRVIWLRQDQVVSQMDHRNRHVSDRQVCRRPPEVSERR